MTDNTTPLGWPVLDSDSNMLYGWRIPGPGITLHMREGVAGYVLAVWALLWHRTIERLQPKDCGAHNKRLVTGGSAWSEHASGTAEDLHWTKHPYGVPAFHTFTSAQVNLIRRRLRWWNRLAGMPVIRWGGDYRRHPDGMHTELYFRLRALKRLAAILKRTSAGKAIIHANPTQVRFL